MSDDAPNANIICSLCGEQISQACLMSPDWSVKCQFDSALIMLRQHLKQIHDIKEPLQQ